MDQDGADALRRLRRAGVVAGLPEIKGIGVTLSPPIGRQQPIGSAAVGMGGCDASPEGHMRGHDQREFTGSSRRSEAWLGSGLGLRRRHHDAVCLQRPRAGFVELISEDFMIQTGELLNFLDRLRSAYPIALHGLSASLGSAEPLDEAYLGLLARLVERVDPVLVSDHLCWSRFGAHDSRGLLPLPFTEESARSIVSKIRRVQSRLDRRILVENVAGYPRSSSSSLTEWEFLALVAEEADCGILLDLNNVYVNARNLGFEPMSYLAALPPERIGQFHLSGNQDHRDLAPDTHDHPIVGTVWDLFRAAVRRFGPRPTIIERDDDITPLGTLLAEMRMAEEVLDAKSAVA